MRCKSPAQAEKILAAAAQLFATHRFHEARMEDISALAEVGKGTLYRYFKDKDELYVALLRSAAVDLMNRLGPCRDVTLDPRRRLVLLIKAILEYFDEQPHLFDLITHAEAMHRPGLEFPWQETRSHTIELTQEIFRAGVAAGQFQVSNVDTTGLVLLGGIRAVIRFGSQPRAADLACQIASTFVGPPRGVSPGAAAESVPTSPSRHISTRSVIDDTSSPVHNS